MKEKLRPRSAIGGEFLFKVQWAVQTMNFSEVLITIASAILLGALFWVTLGTPPAEEQFSVGSKYSLARGFKP